MKGSVSQQYWVQGELELAWQALMLKDGFDKSKVIKYKIEVTAVMED
jgi:hypothetical protein